MKQLLIILGVIAAMGDTILAVWVMLLYHLVDTKEKAVWGIEDELDAVEPSINGRIAGSLVTEAQRQMQITNKRKPLLRKRERLLQDRQFLIDKLPFYKK